MMYCVLLNSSNKNYIQFLKFLLENKSNNIEIIEYDHINNINWALLERYDFTLVLHRYSYVNFCKFIEYCDTKKPILAGLSTYWGVGFPYLLVLSKQAVSCIIKNITNYKVYFEDNLENLCANIILNITNISSMQELLSKTDSDMQILLDQHKILKLDKESYINNIKYNLGYFHNSIFVSFNDVDDEFIEFLKEYHSGKKYIKYKGQPYHLDIGKSFFVIKNYHVGVLPNHNIFVFWHRSTKTWKKARKSLSKKIYKYIQKNFNIALDFSDPGRIIE